MENVQATEGQQTDSQETSVQEGSQPQQGDAQVDKPEETQVKTQAEEMVSRLEYNKARESERKLRSELAKLNKVMENSRTGLTLHEELSKLSPDDLKRFIDAMQSAKKQKDQPEEDDSWLNEYDERVANKFREQKQLKNFVQRDLLSRINQLEQKLNASENWTVGQNEKSLDNTFETFLTQNKIFDQITEGVEESPKFQMIKSFVLSRLSEKYQDPRVASVEDLQEVLNEVKAGFEEIGKQETYKKVQPTVPMSGSRAGQIPKSDKVTSEDVTNLWKTFRQETGW